MNKSDVNKEYDFKNERILEEFGKIDRKLSNIYREILNLESRINSIENKKEVLEAKSIIEDNERIIKDILYRTNEEDRIICERMKEFNERW